MVVICSHRIDWEVRRLADLTGLELLEFLIWGKPDLDVVGQDVHAIAHELILVFRNPGSEYQSRVSDKNSSILPYFDSELELANYLMESYSDKDSAVLDPFGGSGTTAIAAKTLGRCCTWIEINQGKYESATSKIEQTKFWWEI